MKILVATPIFDGMEYCFDKFIASIKKIDFPKFDILIVDNSKNKIFFEKISKQTGFKTIYDDTNEQLNQKRLISSRNKIMDYAKDNGYDFLLFVDTDVIVPENILNELLKANKDVVSGLYYNYFYVSGEKRMMPVAWRYFTEEQFAEIKRRGLYPKINNRLDLRIKRYFTNEEIKSGEIIEAAIPSNGCVLFSRKVIESPFRYGTSEEFHGDDVFFFAHAREKFKFYVHTGIICEHLILGKYKMDSKGNLLHPLGL